MARGPRHRGRAGRLTALKLTRRFQGSLGRTKGRDFGPRATQGAAGSVGHGQGKGCVLLSVVQGGWKLRISRLVSHQVRKCAPGFFVLGLGWAVLGLVGVESGCGWRFGARGLEWGRDAEEGGRGGKHKALSLAGGEGVGFGRERGFGGGRGPGRVGKDWEKWGGGRRRRGRLCRTRLLLNGKKDR